MMNAVIGGSLPDVYRDDKHLLALLLYMFLICFIFLLAVRVICCKFDVVDKPNHRKKHSHNIPIAGGISIYLSVIVLHGFFLPEVAHAKAYLISGGLLVGIGVLDDLVDLPVSPRALIQSLAAFVLMADGLYLMSLGELWFGQALVLGSWGYLVTLLAASAAINAFNMIDGIDGLLAGLCMVTFLGLATCFYVVGQHTNALYCLCLSVILLPFLMLNIGFPFGPRLKVFMGDGGSTLLGFTIIWQVIVICQGKHPAISPSTCLWLIAIPLMDVAAVMFGRLQQKKNPFRPDRTHLHHCLMDCGFSSQKTLLLIVFAAIAIASVGIVFDMLGFSDLFIFLTFIILFIFYIWFRKQLIVGAMDMATK